MDCNCVPFDAIHVSSSRLEIRLIFFIGASYLLTHLLTVHIIDTYSNLSIPLSLSLSLYPSLSIPLSLSPCSLSLSPSLRPFLCPFFLPSLRPFLCPFFLPSLRPSGRPSVRSSLYSLLPSLALRVCNINVISNLQIGMRVCRLSFKGNANCYFRLWWWTQSDKTSVHFNIWRRKKYHRGT